MQRLTGEFQEYIRRIYDPRARETDLLRPGDWDVDRPDDGEFGGGEGIKIVIDWGALDVDRPPDPIRMNHDNNTIVELPRLLLAEFKKPMRDQLTELPIVRFPLSTNPMQDFLNRAKNRPYSYSPIPGTDLYFCGHSSRSQKVERLRVLFAPLTLPDGSGFPDGCATVSVEGGE